METNYIIENNRLIAAFMGFSKIQGSNYLRSPEGVTKALSGLGYHISYDWLLPVVDKIELILKDEGGFYLEGWNCYIETGEVRIDSHPSPESRMHSIYHTVCEFIKIYNERS